MPERPPNWMPGPDDLIDDGPNPGPRAPGELTLAEIKRIQRRARMDKSYSDAKHLVLEKARELQEVKSRRDAGKAKPQEYVSAYDRWAKSDQNFKQLIVDLQREDPTFGPAAEDTQESELPPDKSMLEIAEERVREKKAKFDATLYIDENGKEKRRRGYIEALNEWEAAEKAYNKLLKEEEGNA